MAWSEPQWHPEAFAEAEEAKRWYLERSPSAARGLAMALSAAVQAVAGSPERWPSHRYGCRRYVLPNRYPYSLIYRLSSSGNVQIVAVSHQKRRPGYWKHR